mgnify:CR=1 FL=1
MDMSNMPTWSVIFVLASVTAVCVWGVLEVTKLFIRGWKKSHAGKNPWWYRGALRLLAIVLGGAMGTLLYGTLGESSGWPWGTAIGAGGGTLCTFIVATIKARVAAKKPDNDD